MSKVRRQIIMDTLSDLVGQFLYYDRKEDDALPVGAIEEAIRAGELTCDDIVDKFREHLAKGVSA